METDFSLASLEKYSFAILFRAKRWKEYEPGFVCFIIFHSDANITTRDNSITYYKQLYILKDTLHISIHKKII